MWYNVGGLPHKEGLRQPGVSPGIFGTGGVGTMRDLSIFVDESGDPGTESKYYLIVLVFHEQDEGFARYEADYLSALKRKGLRDIPLHLSPLLNGNDGYKGMDVEERRKYLAAFRVFLQYLPFRYAAFSYKKSELDANMIAPRGAIKRIRRDIAVFLLDHFDQAALPGTPIAGSRCFYCSRCSARVSRLWDVFQIPSAGTVLNDCPYIASAARYRSDRTK